MLLVLLMYVPLLQLPVYLWVCRETAFTNQDRINAGRINLKWRAVVRNSPFPVVVVYTRDAYFMFVYVVLQYETCLER